MGIPIILGAYDWLHTACKNIYICYRQQREKYAVLRQEQSVICSQAISHRQIETLCHCIRGFTCREIADKFGLSVSGVRRNISDMIEKGGFNNKEDPITTAAENKPVVTTLRDTK